MDGSLIIDKPAGITSHDVVARVRRALKIRRVGHAGTLDPFATGVLIVCVGRATRLVQHLVGLDKEYLATVRLGFATNTQDLTGEKITEHVDTSGLTEDEVRRVLVEFTGEQEQVPPMFSAKQIDGQRLYKLARAGKVVERAPVQITVHSIQPIESDGRLLHGNQDGTTDFKMLVRCSSGTYVRTLANDIGERLMCGGHLSALRRTAVGMFGLERSVSLDELDTLVPGEDVGSRFVTTSDTIGHLEKITLSDDEAERIVHGRNVTCESRESRRAGGFVRLCNQAGKLIAVGLIGHDGITIKPQTVFSEG